MDYYGFMQYARAWGRIFIVMYYEDVVSPLRHWSKWMYLLMYSFVPRKYDLGKVSPHWTLPFLHKDMEEGSLTYDIFGYDLISRYHSIDHP